MYAIRKLSTLCRNASILQIVRLLPFSVLLGFTFIWIVVQLQALKQRPSSYSNILSTISERGLIYALVVGLFFLWLPRLPRPKALDSQGMKSYLLALQLGLILAFIPIYLLVWHTPDEALRWYVYPELVNKKWLFAVYWLSVLTFLVFPGLVRKLMEIEIPTPAVKRPARTVRYPANAPKRKAPVPLPSVPIPTAPTVSSEPAPDHSPGVLSRWSRIYAKIALALVMAWYIAGPPWHLDQYHRGIDFHEQLHLGPLQAIDKGYPIDVGPAATAYGPGSQLITYEFMKLGGHFDIVSFRETYALTHLITAFVFCLIVFFLFGIRWGLVALLFALAYSPLHFFFWSPDGKLVGFYGWGNGFRYLGAFVTAPLLAVLAGSSGRRRLPALAPFALGLMFGLCTWLSQENLSAVTAACGLLLGVLWLTGTTSGRTALQLTANMLIGFVVFWIPVLLYYRAHNAIREFWRAYFLYPSTVFRGYSNNYWSSGAGDPQIRAFHFLPAFLIVVGICTLSELPGLRLRRRLDARKGLMLAFLFALAASYPTSLFRSDSSHLMNTAIALPCVLVLAIRDAPGWITDQWQARWGLRIASVALAFYLFPLGPFFGTIYQECVRAPLARFASTSERTAPPQDPRVPFVRATRFLCDEKEVCNGNVPMRQFLEEASAVRALIGSRRTYVEGFPGTYVGIVYFMLDLNPAPYLLDKHLMIINSEIEQEALEYFKSGVRECGAVIADDMTAPEVQIFRDAHPGSKVINRFLGSKPYYLLLAAAPSST